MNPMTALCGALIMSFAAGILFTAAWQATRRRVAAWAEVHHKYKVATRQHLSPVRTGPFAAGVENGPDHACSFPKPCARDQRDTERAARMQAVNEADWNVR